MRYRRNTIRFLMLRMPHHSLPLHILPPKSTAYKLLVSNSHKHTHCYTHVRATPLATCSRMKIQTDKNHCDAFQYRFVSYIQILRFHFFAIHNADFSAYKLNLIQMILTQRNCD